MAKEKRKRESLGARRDARIADPYGLEMRPCRLSEHHRKKGKGATATPQRNCEDNPNCLYGLGEHHKGVWQAKKLIHRMFGEDPRERSRGTVTVAADGGEVEAQAQTPCGLRNLGATCYLNSMLQCLFVNLPFRRAVYEWEPKDETPEKVQQVLQMRALQKLFAQMQLGNQSFYDPSEFASTLSLNNVLQQDAQEFSKLLLAHLRTIFRQSRFSSHWNLVDHIYQGQISYVTKCLRCQTKSMRPSSYYEISLNIKGHRRLEDCIASYLSAEVLEGENKYFCAHCNSKERAERFIELEADALPPTLTLQLLRFVYDANAGRKKKLMDVIEISETMNMTEVLRRSGYGQTGRENGGKDAIYRLSGYLSHRGKSAHVGHYTASVAHRRSGTDDDDWFEFDDAVVNKTDGAKDRGNGVKTIRSRDIYMLYYVRDDSTSTGTDGSVDASSGENVPQPSRKCMNEVEGLNTLFDMDVQEYSSKVEGMEKRIQVRLDAYKRFFEKGQPYADAGSTAFYWVDTEWLRCWVTGEVEDKKGSENTTSTSSTAKKPSEISSASDSTKKRTSNGKQNMQEGVKSEPLDVDVMSSENEHDDYVGSTTESEASPSPMEVDAEAKPDHTPEPTAGKEETVTETSLSPSAASSGTSAVRNEDIPFAKPVDVTPLCCPHSVGFDTAVTNDHKANRELVLRFSPDNVSKLKRVSAKFFTYLQESCNVGDHVVQTSTSSTMKAFSASSYRCVVCETQFRSKLLDDVDHLQQADQEAELLKGSPASVAAIVAAGNAYLMSRAWINSYKSHIQTIQKELSQAANSKKGKKSRATQEFREYFASASVGGANHGTAVTSKGDDAVWQMPINEDITCVHGKLTLEKRKYRAVAPETWSYFSERFPFRAEFPEATTQICPQCQVDEVASKECMEVERAARDNVLATPALDALYRRKPTGDKFRLGDAFELPPAQRGSGLERASTWTKSSTEDTPCRMFLVARSWIVQWRAYIRDVEQDPPPPLNASALSCSHGKLLLSPSLLSAQQGLLVDSSSMDVELVSLEEMMHLAERYGDPEASYYYALLAPQASSIGSDENITVVWRRCSLGSLLYGHESANNGGCPDGVIPLVCEDANSESVTCAECQASSQRRYRDALENFSGRVVHVQQLADDQPVPTSESLTPEANTSGRRRSKRIRPGSASSWSIVANATDTVYMFKAKVYEEIDALPIRQRLYFKGEQLEDYRTLKQYGVKAGDAVFMRLSEDNADDLVMDSVQEREVGFEDSVFLSRPTAAAATTNTASGGRRETPDTSGDRAIALSLTNSVEPSVWVCPACTFVNDDTDVECEMCTTAKDAAS